MAPAKPRQQIELDAASGQVVEDLVGGDFLPVSEAASFFHVRCVEVAHSERDDFAGEPKLRECLERFGERDRAAPVQQAQVNGVDAKPAQAPFAGGDGAASCGIVRIDLADQKYFVTPAANRFANQLLGGALTVHLGGIDQRHPQIDPALKRSKLVGSPALVLAHIPRTKAERRYLACGG